MNEGKRILVNDLVTSNCANYKTCLFVHLVFLSRVLSRILYSRCFGSYRRNPNIHALWACNLGP